MNRSIISELDKMSESLSTLSTQFAYRLMNLCVKSEPVSLLSVSVTVEGEQQTIENCAQVSKDDDFTFKVFPNYDSDIPVIAQAIFKVHPEFKQEMKTVDIDIINEEGQTQIETVNYILLTMPEVNDDRYDVLNDGVKVLYEGLKAQMEAVIARANAKLVLLMKDMNESDIEKIKSVRDDEVKTWTEQRDKIYNDKLKEIDDAHKKWLAKQAEERVNQIKNMEH